MLHSGSAGKFVVQDGTNDLITIARSTGKTVVRGDIVIGNIAENRTASVVSTNSSATLLVESKSNGDASVDVKAASGRNAVLSLNEGAASYQLMADGRAGKFVVQKFKFFCR